MIAQLRALFQKDLKLVLAGGVGLAQPVLLGLLLIFVFSTSLATGELASPQAAAAIFWVASCFSQVLIFNTLYGLEEANGARIALLLSPVSIHAIWLGKALAGFALLVLSQLVFLPAAIAFLGQSLHADCLMALGGLLLVDWGVVVLGALLGALAQGQAAKESLLTVILFPLLIPLLLAGVRIGAAYFSAGAMHEGNWMGLAFAFDALFTGAALFLFPAVYGAEG
ncbi:heme exporter protein CcmB [Desulfobaculum bizertense]|uniref:heme exporter protein CcmB n=1 Tax=Desulfobaculum bizertense TaxID=376490 RepID=UPI001F204448|nr:heme exporter protein CcmB [Desulfobaculum bizertense]UIJ38099.1 heme exporter protein CcmB [Desulfobaculum bizertense]